MGKLMTIYVQPGWQRCCWVKEECMKVIESDLPTCISSAPPGHYGGICDYQKSNTYPPVDLYGTPNLNQYSQTDNVSPAKPCKSFTGKILGCGDGEFLTRGPPP